MGMNERKGKKEGIMERRLCEKTGEADEKKR
jgi:hypothetical protein